MDAFLAACRAAGVPALDYRPAARAYYERTGLFPSGFDTTFPSKGHWNAAGHRIAAELILDHVRSRGGVGGEGVR